MTPDGIQLHDGTEYTFDLIILATGFDTGTGALTRMDIHGRGGRSLTEEVCEPTKEAEDQWVQHHEEIAAATLVPKTVSWYMGSNVRGKPRWLLSYIGGVGQYRAKCDEVAREGYPGFAMR